MMRKWKRITAIICTFAVAVSSLTVSTPKVVKADAPDWSNINYLGDGAGGGAYTNKYKFYREGGSAVNIQQPPWASAPGIYATFPATITATSLGDKVSIDGAGAVFHLSAFTDKVTEFTVTAGATYTCYVYYEDAPDPNTPTNLSIDANNVVTWTGVVSATSYEVNFNGQTYNTTSTTYNLSTAISNLDTCGTYQIKVRSVISDGNTTEYSKYASRDYTYDADGVERIPADKRNSGVRNVSAYDGGHDYDNQYVVAGLYVEQNKYYVLSYNITSTQHRWFGMRLEKTNAWTPWYEFSPAFEKEVRAGETVKVVEVVQASETMDIAQIGIFMGYVHGASPATNVTISDLSLISYPNEAAAQAAKQAILNPSTDTVMTSNDISVKGFQINLSNPAYGVAFRTIASAPESTVTVDETSYTIKSYGLVYSFDSVNTTGNHANNTIDASYCILNTEPVLGHAWSYVGKKDAANTFGYIASDNAFVDLATETGKKSYVATMVNMDATGIELYAKTIYVRAYVITTTGEFIYSTRTAKVSVAQVADKMYRDSAARTLAGHEFLYNNILHTSYLSGLGNIYYKTAPVEYGWNNNLYTPGN